MSNLITGLSLFNQKLSTEAEFKQVLSMLAKHGPLPIFQRVPFVGTTISFPGPTYQDLKIDIKITERLEDESLGLHLVSYLFNQLPSDCLVEDTSRIIETFVFPHFGVSIYMQGGTHQDIDIVIGKNSTEENMTAFASINETKQSNADLFEVKSQQIDEYGRQGYFTIKLTYRVIKFWSRYIKELIQSSLNLIDWIIQVLDQNLSSKLPEWAQNERTHLLQSIKEKLCEY